MIRFLIFVLIGLLIYFLVLNLRGETFSRKQRIQSILIGVAVITTVVLSLVFEEYQLRSKIHDELLAKNYSSSEPNHYATEINGVKISVEYQSGYGDNRNEPRLSFVAKFSNVSKNLEALFCHSDEYERYINSNYGWYPTPEIKLTNDHFIGKCYPESVKNEVKALSKRVHDFVPDEARYLFLPSPENLEESTLKFYTENLDTSNLTERLEDLLNYYEKIFRP